MIAITENDLVFVTNGSCTEATIYGDQNHAQVGDAQVSEKHSGFVINRGNATASDVMQLISDVKDKVKEQFGVTMEPEVKRVGRF